MAYLTLAAVAAMNGLGLRTGCRAQQLLTVAKMVVFAVIVVAFFGVRAEATAPVAASGGPIGLGAIALALPLVHDTYSGWHSGVYFCEEDRDPGRNVPRSLFIGVLAIAATYIPLNVALLHVLGIAALAGSKLAVADAALHAFGEAADRVVTSLSLVSVLGNLNVSVMYVPRILIALGCDGFSARTAGRMSGRGTPHAATLATMPLVAGLEFDTLFAVDAFVGLALYAVIYASLFALRRREPGLVRPIGRGVIPGSPAPSSSPSIGLAVAFVLAAPATSLTAALAIAASHLVYRWLARRS